MCSGGIECGVCTYAQDMYVYILWLIKFCFSNRVGYTKIILLTKQMYMYLSVCS